MKFLEAAIAFSYLLTTTTAIPTPQDIIHPLPEANHDIGRHCACPTLEGSFCRIVQTPGLARDAPNSAQCQNNAGVGYTCADTFDKPNCNLCTQAFYGNYVPGTSQYECTGPNNWSFRTCSSDHGATFNVCATGETSFQPMYNTTVVFGGNSASINIGQFKDVESAKRSISNRIINTVPELCPNTVCLIGGGKASSGEIDFLDGGVLSRGKINFKAASGTGFPGGVQELSDMTLALATQIAAAITCSDVIDYTTAEGDCVKHPIGCAGKGRSGRFCTAPGHAIIVKREWNIASTVPYGLEEPAIASLHLEMDWQNPLSLFSCDTLTAAGGLISMGGELNPFIATAGTTLGFLGSICSTVTTSA